MSRLLWSAPWSHFSTAKVTSTWQTELRQSAYKVYQQYEALAKRDGLWDDGDRVLAMLNQSKMQPLSAVASPGFVYDRVYVDEVQDSTQAEIVLYLLAAGMNANALFLAGDPAQSVVEGVDFRFEEVLSIVHQLSGGKARIERPVKLTVNYRSHAGILNVAGAVLDKLFAMFPGAAKVLPKDEGLFQGPRPAFALCELGALLKMNEKLVVLCRDDCVEQVENAVRGANAANVVLGIRAAKGLEFQDVVLFDFVSSIRDDDRKPWIELFTKETQEQYKYPQLEAQVKLLYTAITRSCNRLIFVESRPSRVVEHFHHWMICKGLVEPFHLSQEVVFMTGDEWRAQGIEFALAAEGEAAVAILSKALHYFTMAGDNNLKQKAMMHMQLHQTSAVLADSDMLSFSQEAEIAEILRKALSLGFREESLALLRATVGKTRFHTFLNEFISSND